MKRGKYAHVIDKLPRFPGVQPERKAIVDAVRDEVLAPPRDDENISRELDVERATAMIGAHVGEILRQIKRTCAGRHHASEFARAYAHARDLKAAISEWESSTNLLIEVLQALMVDHGEQEGVTAMKLASGRSVSWFDEPYAQVQDREAFRQYCESDPDLRRKMALPWQTTNSLVKELLLAGEPEPPGVTCFAKTTVRLGSE